MVSHLLWDGSMAKSTPCPKLHHDAFGLFMNNARPKARVGSSRTRHPSLTMKKPAVPFLLFLQMAIVVRLSGSFSILPSQQRTPLVCSPRRRTKPTTTACRPPAPPHRCSSLLFGINEWRAEKQHSQHDSSSPDLQQCCECPVWLLPFQVSDLLLLGEKRTIVLNEGRFFDLFQDVVDEEHSIMGMALMGDDYLHPTIVLCEISDYQIDTGFRGRISIQATLESVGRAEMTQLLQMKPVMKATCKELVDDDESSSLSLQVLVEDQEEMTSLANQVNDLVSALLSPATAGSSSSSSSSSTATLRYDSLEELSWKALALARQRCGTNELLESFQMRNVKSRLVAVRRLLLRYAMAVSQEPNSSSRPEGPPWISSDDESSVFE
jgi:hypothetical protein